MKVLILSCNTGQGHNSCADAIKIVIEKHGDSCCIEDSLSFISKRMSDFISNWHVRIYRYMPGLFRWGYDFAERHPRVFHEKSIVHKLLTSGSELLFQYILENDFDTIICTHVFSALILTDVLNKYPLEIKTSFVATDYTCSPSMDESDLDYYFVPKGDSIAEDFVKEGIDKDKLVYTGIPVRSIFHFKMPKDEARQHLGISLDQKHLLFMCGSMGCGPVTKVFDELLELISDDIFISVVCGTNKHLYKKLIRKAQDYKNVHVYGYTSDIPVLMDSADLYLTKPGGISVTEAAVKCLPMVFMDSVAGCESYNMDYFITREAAVTAKSSKELAEKCVVLLNDSAGRKGMVEKLEALSFSDAAEEIYQFLS